MPQPFSNAAMTNAGAALLTKAQAGECRIEFTRIAIGNGAYAAEEKDLSVLQAMTGLKSPRNSYFLSDIDVVSDHSVKVTALITNQDPATGEALVGEGYYINEMGLYAKEKDGGAETEVLYSIAVTLGENGDFMPPYNGYSPAQIIQDYYATINNSAEVTIQTGMGAVALAEDLQQLKRDKADISRSQAATIRADSWTGEGVPYCCTLEVEGATETNNIEVLPPPELSREQFDAMADALIVGGGQGDGYIQMVAWGEKPEIDLPVIIIVRGD